MLKSTAFCLLILAFGAIGSAVLPTDEPPKPIRIGMIGLDTSHCLAFAEVLNKSDADPQLAGCKVVLVYPKGSPDIESSVKRVPEYTEKIKALGVEIVEDLDAMIAQVDAVLLETNDGRPHLGAIVPPTSTGMWEKVIVCTSRCQTFSEWRRLRCHV